MNSSAYNAWKLVSLSPLPGWALVLLALVVVAGVTLAAWGVLREPSRRRRAILWALRIAAGVAVLFFVLEPGVRQLQVARVKNRVAILVDRSASMGFPVAPGGESREKATADFLRRVAPDLQALQDRFSIEVYGFDPELAPTSADQLAAEPPRAGRTDLLAALRALKGGEGAGTKKLSGVLMFSDGADNVELGNGLTGRAKSTLADLDLPVSTFAVGEEALKDVAIEQVKVDDFAFVRNSITVEAEVTSRGFGGRDVPVVLRREGQVVGTRTLKLPPDGARAAVSFQFTPDRTGRFVYTISVPVFPEEAVSENNSRSFVLKVIRDRIRVLYVVGRPSWDERFLRGLLRQDPNIDLISFYILRTLADDTLTVNQDRELSLIPFPTDEIFDTKLKTFDVVIFQNFGYTDPGLSIERYEGNLERFVHDHGGGFVVIGGDKSFGEGHASFHDLAPALPVESLGLPASQDLFRPKLTPQGARHPITAVGNGAEESESMWNALPEIPGANLVRARPGASVLLSHPGAQVDGQPAPVLAAWEYGSGRTMALMVDSSWYWAFPAHKAGSPTRAYERLWSNALRWLVRDPDLTTLRVTADPPSVEPGKPIGVVVAARTPDYQAAADAQVQVELINVETQKKIGQVSGTTGADGTIRLELPPPDPGAYRLVARAQKLDKQLGEGEDAVAVRAVGHELSDASVRADILADISRLTGGRAYRLSEGRLPEVPLLDPPVVEVGRSRDQPLWDRWYYLVALVVLLGLEWTLRRRFGYV